MIIEKVTHDTYASQLTQRITDPLRLRSTCLAPYTCPPSDAARMPAGYLYIAGVPASLLGQAMPPLALTWAQGAGGIVTSLADMTTWDRALYSGQLLPPRQQHQLESLVSEATGQPIAHTTPASRQATAWAFSSRPAPDRRHLGLRGPDLRQPGRACVLPPLRHHHRARGQQRDVSAGQQR